jgi:hypothetical protein
VFDERQVQELSVDLKWQPGIGYLNQDNTTTPNASTNALNQSKCSVTVTDPYLTGLAWPVLYDAASIYTASTVAAANSIMLPACGEGQDPLSDKCFKSPDIETDNSTSDGGDFAFLLISLWYDVAGTSFGTDFYFRVTGFSVAHGIDYPRVTIQGAEARSIVFNQSLVNQTYDEGAEVEKVLKDIAEQNGYSVSFCVNTNDQPEAKRLLPRSIRFRGVTPDEAIQKILNSVGGTSTSLPIRDYANKISMCTRGELNNRTCSVFYLGKGLYEGYDINGQPDLSLIGKNAEYASNKNNGDPYRSEAFNAQTYVIQNIAPNLRKEALKNVKKIAFPKLFESITPHIKGALRTTAGFVWKDSKPAPNTSGGKIAVINERVKDTILYGIAPNGTTAISFLTGEVKEADATQGRVLINTKFGLRICKPDDDKKCFHRQIRQESTGLNSVKVKINDKVAINQEIGTSTAEKPEFTRFFIDGYGGEQVTLNPQLVWDWAIPEEEIKKLEPANAPASAITQIVPPAPKATAKDWNANTTQKPTKVLLMAGHADFPSGAPNEKALNIELVKWAQRNAASYGISDFVDFYFPPSSNVPENDVRSQFRVTEQAIAAGKQVIEVHNDKADGRSGVIPPRNNKRIWQSDNALANAYGAFSINHRDGLGIPNRGGTILEVGRMDTRTTQVFTSGTSAQKDALYRQLMDPTMRAIAAEKARAGGTAPPSTTSAPAPTSQKICFRMGDSGSSTGSHLHAQWTDRNRPITAEQVRKYVDVPGTVSSTYLDPKRTDHRGVDIANNLGTPMCLKDGVSVKQVADAKCPNGQGKGSKCGAPGFEGFGNAVVISTPEGDIILAHLDPGGIPSNIEGLRSSSGGGKGRPNIQAAPVTQGLTVETSFNGVPRSLRIIPGQTILSFISDYDAWVENGGPRGRDNGRDPGVWIPQRFANWFVTQCGYKWREGNLRVNIEARSAWGTGMVSVPTFGDYLTGMRKSGDIKNTKDYFGYIRSIGDLNWKIEKDGKFKDSTDEYCAEASWWTQNAGSTPGSSSTDPVDTQGSFPAANCRTGNAAQDEIINALYSAGLKTPNAFAGALGNLQEESNFNPNIHNTPIQGLTCVTDSSNPPAGRPEKCYGLVQWGGVRKVNALRKCGQVSTLQCQLEFMVQEIRQRGGGLVEGMNAARSASAAAEIWRRQYEVASGGIAKRQQFAEQIARQIKCDRPAQ